MGVSRALRRAAAKKAFKENIKMSDLDKEFTEVANSEAIKKMTVDIVTMMIRAACLVMCDFKQITKKETRVETTVRLMHDYVLKIRGHELSREETKILQDVGAAMKQSIGEEDEDNGK